MYLELSQVTGVISQMGCCVSTNSEATASALGSSHKHPGSAKASSKLKGFRHESRAPPPPSVEEEEAVKEVLSETPKPKPKPILILPQQPEPVLPAEMKQDLPEDEEEKETKIISAHKVEAFPKLQEKQNLSSNEEIISQVSEICSVSISESVSTTTTNVADKRNNEEEELEATKRQRVISRSPAKQSSRTGFRRDWVVNQSLTRKSDQSPDRRISNGSVRKVLQTQESVRVRGPVRSEPGEISGRRSRSPATTRTYAAMGRTPSARRTNKSPGRVRSGPIENNSNGNISGRKMEDKWVTNNNNNDNSKENCSANESLENPFVSLECFIFL